VDIRRIHSDEWPAFRDLRLRALRGEPDAFGSTHAEESTRSDDHWIEWVAELAEGGPSFGVVAIDDVARLIGMAVGAPHRDHPGEAGLFAMWVEPLARGAGTGRVLVDAVVGWARSTGFPVVRVQVTESNGAAVRLYTRCGFSDEGTRVPLREGSDVVTLIMTMDL
jgi:ribosomal protein S18 acetylase RimI-like enzyme